MRIYILSIPILYEIGEGLVKIFEVFIYGRVGSSSLRRIVTEFETCIKIYENDFLQFQQLVIKKEKFSAMKPVK